MYASIDVGCGCVREDRDDAMCLGWVGGGAGLGRLRWGEGRVPRKRKRNRVAVAVAGAGLIRGLDCCCVEW
jgi:hypothetical protein